MGSFRDPFQPNTERYSLSKCLILSLNSLTGGLPDELCNALALQRINVIGNTNLQGMIPSCLGNLPALTTLELDENMFTGRIPPELSSMMNLEFLTFAENDFTGPIPEEISGNLNLRAFDIEQNRISGPIPTSFGSLSQMETLVCPMSVRLSFSHAVQV